MAATAHFMSEGKEAQGGKMDPELFVPSSAVMKDGDVSTVWRLVDSRVKRTAIEAGEAREGRVHVLSGLKPGEQVVIDPPATLKDDELVKVLP
jgi:multidrug efflux pump subunit AcrA (membrane-fusion protein)